CRSGFCTSCATRKSMRIWKRSSARSRVMRTMQDTSSTTGLSAIAKKTLLSTAPSHISPRTVVFPWCSLCSKQTNGRLQENSEPSRHRLPDEGGSREARARMGQAVAGDEAVRAGSQGFRGAAEVRPARRSTVCQRRYPHAACGEQGAQGHRREDQEPRGLRCAV